MMNALRVPVLVLLAAVLVAAPVAPAAAVPVQIQFTGLDLVYDGTTLHDAGSLLGGGGEPAESDPLISMHFLQNGSLLGTLTSDIWADIRLSVSGIPAAGGTGTGSGDIFDLLTQSACSDDCWGLALNVNDTQVTYNAGAVSVTGSGTVASIYAQNLPFGITIGQPIVFSFSANVTDGTLTTSGGNVTGFSASGTGEVTGVPEPGLLLLLGTAFVGIGGWVRRRARR
jgi:hypothetical protein